MKKSFLVIILLSTIVLTSKANPIHKGGDRRDVAKATQRQKEIAGSQVCKKNDERPKYTCFEVDFILSCGKVWGGSVCVQTTLSYITDEQFDSAWNLKNNQLCGNGQGTLPPEYTVPQV